MSLSERHLPLQNDKLINVNQYPYSGIFCPIFTKIDKNTSTLA